MRWYETLQRGKGLYPCCATLEDSVCDQSLVRSILKRSYIDYSYFYVCENHANDNSNVDGGVCVALPIDAKVRNNSECAYYFIFFYKYV